MTLSAAIDIVDQSKCAFEQDSILQTLVSDTERDGFPASSVFSKQFEESSRVKISEACHHYAETDQWPLLPAGQQLLVYERLKAAREFLWVLQTSEANRLGSPIQIAPLADRSSLLSFLLVHYWAMIALDRWLLKYGRR